MWITHSPLSRAAASRLRSISKFWTMRFARFWGFAMWLGWIPIVITTSGLIICVRGQNLAADPRAGSIARLEAERATEAGTLLTILTSPWLTLTAILVG